MHNPKRECIAGALVGLACGDALGATNEFLPRGSFEPLDDIVGGGVFNLKAGEWTDDTSMALCLAESLIESDGFNAEDQMHRYVNWWKHGYLSSNGTGFGIGDTVSHALECFLDTNAPFAGATDLISSGNGSIMRLAPIPMFYHADYEQCIEKAALSSRTTHASSECVDACQLFASFIFHAFDAESKREIFENSPYIPFSPKLRKLIDINSLCSLDATDIKGSGYVVESLEAALWCFLHGNSYEESVLLAANLGDDADTTAAVCGQLAGAFYGLSAIPSRWRKIIAMSDLILDLAEKLVEAGLR